ncbi:MAG: DNA polymerase I, partial [Clostridia bacterium]|nr:DNA polymerase I [Clostridia bacterium]
MEILVLIDGNSLINRAFYAMPLLTTKKGEYTNAVYGFMNMLFKIFTDIKPTHMAVAFDVKAPTFRHKMYADYKGTRKPMPEELRPQIPLLKELLKQMNITVLEKAGVEADDIIGTVAKKTDILTYIFTGDKDALQLVDEQTEVHFTKRGITDVEIYTIDNFTEKTTLEPWGIIELKALMGDSSDNIPGIAGVGEKTALSLLAEYKTVENLYQNVDNLKGKLKEKVQTSKDACFMSKTLATINTDCGIEFTVDGMKTKTPFDYSVKERFYELEFKTLANRDSFFLFQEEDKKEEKQVSVTTKKIGDLTALDTAIFNGLLSLHVGKDSVNLFSKDTEYLLPLRQTLLDDGFNLSEVLEFLVNNINSSTDLVLFDKKEFLHLIKNSLNKIITVNADDVSIMKYLVDYDNGAETIEKVIAEYGLNINTPAFSFFTVYQQLNQKLVEFEAVNLYKKVELPLVDILFDMETAGFKVDYDALNTAGETFKNRLTTIENQIRELSGEPTLNVNSPKQLGELLFEKLKVGKGKKTKTGYSTSAEVLESLEDTHHIIPIILEYRSLSKLYSTYIEGFKPLIDKQTGLIHTSFNQTVTSTGRLSSKEPNLQNIPVR